MFSPCLKGFLRLSPPVQRPVVGWVAFQNACVLLCPAQDKRQGRHLRFINGGLSRFSEGLGILPPRNDLKPPKHLSSREYFRITVSEYTWHFALHVTSYNDLGAFPFTTSRGVWPGHSTLPVCESAASRTVTVVMVSMINETNVHSLTDRTARLKCIRAGRSRATSQISEVTISVGLKVFTWPFKKSNYCLSSIEIKQLTCT